MYSELDKLWAMGRVLARVAMDRAARPDAPANEVIEAGPLLPAWRPGAYAAGAVLTHNGQPWRCAQAHDSTGQTGWEPGGAPALWSPCHATDAAHALPWVQPAGTHDMYRAGECMIWTDGQRYRCLSDTVYSPLDYGQAWEEVT